MQLYYHPASPPSRAVLLLCQALNLQPELKVIDSSKGDNVTPEYLKINPQHTIPVIIDDGFVLSESRAILGYLAEKYGMSLGLYPTDPKARGVVNQRLMFDLGTLYQKTLETYIIPLFRGDSKKNENSYEKLKEALEWLEIFLGDAPYMAGDRITIADYSITSTISTIKESGMDLSPYPKVSSWFQKMKEELKNYQGTDGEGAKMLGNLIKNALNID